MLYISVQPLTMPIMIYNRMEHYSSGLRDVLCLPSDTLVSLVFMNVARRLLISTKYNKLHHRASSEVIASDQQIKFINHFNGQHVLFRKGVTVEDAFDRKRKGGPREWISEYFADAL